MICDYCNKPIGDKDTVITCTDGCHDAYHKKCWEAQYEDWLRDEGWSEPK